MFSLINVDGFVPQDYNLFSLWKYFISEVSLDKPSITSQASEFVDIFRHLIRLRYRSRNILPGISDLKALLDKTYPGVEPERGSDYGLLYHVGATLMSQQSPLTMGELSRSMDVPLSTATRMVDWLEKGGFIERLTDPNDRRIVRVKLTETGETIYRTTHELMCKRIEKSLSRFTLQERETLVLLLHKLVVVMEEEFKGVEQYP